MLKIYRASAGSGKTHRLTKDYIHLLFSGRYEDLHRRILAVTFTNKATEEMKSRILKELYLLSIGEKSDYREDLCAAFHLSEGAVDQRAHKILKALLHDFSSFSISTIDSFFQQIIRSFAREIGVNGTYNLELDSDNILSQSVDELIFDLSKEENRQLLGWLTRFAEERVEQSQNWNPRRSIEELGKEIFKESYQYKAEETNRKLHDREFLVTYRKKLDKIKTDFEDKIKSAAQRALGILQRYSLSHEDFSYKSTSVLEKIPEEKLEVSNRFRAMAEDVDNCYKKTAPQGLKSTIQTAYQRGLRDCFVEIINMLDNDIVVYNSAEIILKNINTFGILSDLAVQIKKLTGEQNTMLISDTNMLLNKIIDNSDTPFVYEKTGVHIDHFMIDEFQDTSKLQWKNFLPLIANSMAAGKYNLVVGDVKQSIYRWRNSDWNLLDEEILQDFRDDETIEENLDTNWRSDKNVVAFNNEFFNFAALLLQDKFNEALSPVLPVYPGLEPLTTKILHAYKHVHQDVAEKAGLGSVRFSFIKENDEEKWKELSLKKLPGLLEDIQSRGYKPGDVTILVRKNDEARIVTETLLQYKNSEDARPGFSYEIMGNEGLAVQSASSVKFILGVLRLMVNPGDKLLQTTACFEYLKIKKRLNEGQALAQCFSSGGDPDFFSILTDSEKADFKELQKNSLFDMVEHLISMFDLGSWNNEAIFLQAFQDVVYKISSTKSPDIYSFLKWWDKNGARQSVSVPENENAFRVMTVHKSKGLESKVIVVPFCDWNLDSNTGLFKNVLWCEPQEEPFNELSLLPVEYSKKLGQSIFAQTYFDELMHQYIDNLNVAYVAFTRARNELICHLPYAEKGVEDTSKINSVASLLQYSFTHQNIKNDGIRLNENFLEDELVFELGKAPLNEISKIEKQNPEFSEKISNYPSVSSSDRLRIRQAGFGYWVQGQDMNENRLNYGLIMHDILKNIRTKSDQQDAIDAMVREGRINEVESKEILMEMEKFWKISGVEQWFREDVEIMNEVSILLPGGKIHRPDRVVLNGNQAIIIDYKFGDRELKKYLYQVKEYMSLVKSMGFDTKGYLCYVSLDKVVEVN